MITRFGSSKRVAIHGGLVLKQDLGGHKGACVKQAHRLVGLRTLGFRTSQVFSINDDGSIWAEYICGPTLKEVKEIGLSALQASSLKRIVEKQIEQRLYIGDLNHKNLIWKEDEGEWVIIDCGAVRRQEEEEIRARIEKKWGFLP